MKKFLSILLAAALLAAVCAVPAFAADTVVGADGGVTTFDPTTTGGQDLNIQVSDVTHKYAVDVTFDLSDLTIGGSITWNVDSMKYDVEGTTLTDTTRTIEVSNRSDLPVYAYATVSNTDDNDGISITADKNSAANKLTIEKAIAASTGEEKGTANAKNLTLSITSTDWNAVAEYYAQKKLAADETVKTFKIATVTVTISKD